MTTAAEPQAPTISSVYVRHLKSGRDAIEYCVAVKQGQRVEIHAFRAEADAESFARSQTLALLEAEFARMSYDLA